MDLDKFVEEFAFHTAAQHDTLFKEGPRTANRHNARALAAFDKLRAQGQAGWDALATLLTHARMDVRVAAAALVLRHRTQEALAVLEEATQSQGLVGLEASQVLKYWAEGTWDPEALGQAPSTPPNPRKKRPKPK